MLSEIIVERCSDQYPFLLLFGLVQVLIVSHLSCCPILKLLSIFVLSPGTYDVSNYSLHWNLFGSGDQEDKGAGLRLSSGTCQGHPYYVTVATGLSFLQLVLT